jgi:hypothetical protein
MEDHITGTDGWSKVVFFDSVGISVSWEYIYTSILGVVFPANTINTVSYDISSHILVGIVATLSCNLNNSIVALKVDAYPLVMVHVTWYPTTHVATTWQFVKTSQVCYVTAVVITGRLECLVRDAVRLEADWSSRDNSFTVSEAIQLNSH